MAFSDDSKQWLETGDYPTQAQFAQICDWLRWKDQPLTVDEITGLTDLLNALSSPIQKFVVGVGQTHINYSVPVGFVNSKIYVVPYSTCVTNVDDISEEINLYTGVSPDDDITPTNGLEWDVSIFAPAVARNIQVGPLPVGSIVYVVRTKIF